MCDENFSKTFKTKINGNEEDIYIGPLDKEGIITEEKCNLDAEYIKCRTYLDGLTKIDKFIILFYTLGTISKILSLFNRNQISKDSPITLSDNKQTFYNTLFLFIKYMYKLKLIEDTTIFYANFLKKMIIKIADISLDEIKKLSKIFYNNNYDSLDEYYKNIFLIEDEVQMIQYKILFDHIISDILKKNKLQHIYRWFINYDKQEFVPYNMILPYLLDRYFETNLLHVEFLNNLNKDLDNIINNAPPLEKCIRVYRAADYYSQYKIGEIVTNKTVLSTSCSQKSNIFFFNSDKQCCIAEYILKPGTCVLFLNYDETAYGNKMYEVIVQKNICCKVIKKENKNIVEIDSEQNELEDSIPYKIGHMQNMTYTGEINENNVEVYLLKQVDC